VGNPSNFSAGQHHGDENPPKDSERLELKAGSVIY
jgi:hypothetical protein